MKVQTQRLMTSTAMMAGLVLSGMAAAGDMSSAEKIKKMDTNGDGQISMAEHDAGARMMFTAMDANKDGNVTAAEMDAMMKDHARMGGMKSGDMKSHTMESGDMKSGDMKSHTMESGDMNSETPMPADSDDGN